MLSLSFQSLALERIAELTQRNNVNNPMRWASPLLQFPSKAEYLSDVQKGQQTQPERNPNFHVKFTTSHVLAHAQ